MTTTISSQEETLKVYPQALVHMVKLDNLGAIVNFNVDATARCPPPMTLCPPCALRGSGVWALAVYYGSTP